MFVFDYDLVGVGGIDAVPSPNLPNTPPYSLEQYLSQDIYQIPNPLITENSSPGLLSLILYISLITIATQSTAPPANAAYFLYNLPNWTSSI